MQIIKYDFLVLGLNTKDHNDASGHRTSAIIETLIGKGKLLAVFTIQKSKLKAEVKALNVKNSLFGGFYGKVKNKLVFRLILELLISVECIFRLAITAFRSKTIWISSPPYFFSLTLAAVGLLLKKRIFFDVKDIYPEVFLMTGVLTKNSVLFRLLDFINTYIICKCEVVAATQGILMYYEQRFPNIKLRLLLNGSNIYASPREKNFNETFNMVFHGRLGRFQNIEFFERIITAHSQINFNLFTQDKFSLFSGCYPKNLKVYDVVNTEVLIKKIQSAHLGISLRDNSELTKMSNAVKAFDYIACGTPVISSPETELDEHLSNTGLYKSFPFNDFYNLNKFLNNITGSESAYRIAFPNSGKPLNMFNRRTLTDNFFNSI